MIARRVLGEAGIPLGVRRAVGIATTFFLAACGAPGSAPAGSRSFDRMMMLEDSAATSANVSLGDLDGDGHLDIVLVKGRHWPLPDLVRLGDGNGDFTAPERLGPDADRSYSGVLVDLDGDGDLDVVVSNDDPDPKRVYHNRGDGRFDEASTFGRPEWSTRHVSVADLNGDGAPDAVLANRGGQTGTPSRICMGDGAGGFRDPCAELPTGSSTTITPADFDGDGAIDLAVPHRDGGQSYVYLNDGSGLFAERRPFGPPDAAIRSARAVDLNGDGFLDLAVIDQEGGPGVFYGAPDVRFGAMQTLDGEGETPYAIAVADLDGNGRADVIVGFVEARPRVYFNDVGDGTFTAVPFGDAEGAAYGFAVGDVDEDGYLDIAMARSGAVNVLYFGSAGGT